MVIRYSLPCLLWSSRLDRHMEHRNKVSQLQQSGRRISTLGSTYGTDHLYNTSVHPQSHTLGVGVSGTQAEQYMAPVSPTLPSLRYTNTSPTTTTSTITTANDSARWRTTTATSTITCKLCITINTSLSLSYTCRYSDVNSLKVNDSVVGLVRCVKSGNNFRVLYIVYNLIMQNWKVTFHDYYDVMSLNTLTLAISSTSQQSTSIPEKVYSSYMCVFSTSTTL